MQSIEDAKPSPRTSKCRIILVDDELDIIFTFKKGLEDHGFEVDSFNDPLSALSNFKAGVYDVALIDKSSFDISTY